MQVIRELRHGVKLKKVVYSRTPIEYELTPYEILMDDIRSRRYKLNKVMVNGNIPAPVKKDAHAIILEFIRSRPPLKKVIIIIIFLKIRNFSFFLFDHRYDPLDFMLTFIFHSYVWMSKIKSCTKFYWAF